MPAPAIAICAIIPPFDAKTICLCGILSLYGNHYRSTGIAPQVTLVIINVTISTFMDILVGIFPDTERFVLGGPSAHVDFLNCERIADRQHIHGWSVEEHYHDGLAQLFVFDKGRVKSVLDHKHQEIIGPALVWLPALVPHGFEYEIGLNAWVITVPSIDIKRIVGSVNWLQQWVDSPQVLEGRNITWDLSPALDIVASIEVEHRMHGRDSNFALESLFRLLLVTLNRGITTYSPRHAGYTDRKQSLVNRFQDLIEQRSHATLGVSDYAEMLSVTSTHLSRTVKVITGRTAGEILADRTLLTAKRALAFTDMPISEIAFDLGFSSSSYFSRTFRSQVGQTPREFRRAKRN